MTRYHLSLHIQFKQDVDLKNVEKELGVVAYKKYPLSESKGKNKTAKIWFKTDDTTEVDTLLVLSNFVNSFSDNFEKIKMLCKQFDGTCTLTLYFEDFDDKPYIQLTTEIMKKLSDCNINFETDFRM